MATIGIAGLLTDDPKLNIMPIAFDSYGVLCSPKHPFARRRATKWASLRGEIVIGSDASEMLIAAGLADGLPSTDLVITSRAPLFSCVRKHLGHHNSSDADAAAVRGRICFRAADSPEAHEAGGDRDA